MKEQTSVFPSGSSNDNKQFSFSEINLSTTQLYLSHCDETMTENRLKMTSMYDQAGGTQLNLFTSPTPKKSFTTVSVKSMVVTLDLNVVQKANSLSIQTVCLKLSMKRNALFKKEKLFL